MNRELLPVDPRILKPQLRDGIARTPRDRASVDLINTWERVQYLKGKEEKGQVRQNDYNHDREMKKANRELRRAENAYLKVVT